MVNSDCFVTHLSYFVAQGQNMTEIFAEIMKKKPSSKLVSLGGIHLYAW